MTDPQMQRIRELFEATDSRAQRKALLQLAEERVKELIERLPPDVPWTSRGNGVKLELMVPASLPEALVARIPRLAAEPQGEVETR